MITPPTDSIYKFLAISGVVLIIWGASFPWKKSHELNLEIAKLETLAEEVKIKRKSLDDQVKFLQEEANRIKKSPKHEQYEQKLAALNTKLHEVYLELLKLKKPVREKSNTLIVLNKSSSQFWFLGIIAMVLGCICAILGFSLWYLRVQKHIDRNLSKNEEENSQSET